MRFKLPKRRRIYILPTGFGAVFIVGATLMILIGASYQNNLVNLLAYFSLSLIFIAMIQTHNNLARLKIESVQTDGAAVGDEILVTTVVANEAVTPRFAIEVRPKNADGLKYQSSHDNIHPVIGRSFLKLRTTHVAHERGRRKIKKVRLSTVYPLGLFRAWSWEAVEQTYFVFPKAIGSRPLPPPLLRNEVGEDGNAYRGEDFEGHRNYVLGDSARHIDWKARARGRPLLVKEFGGGNDGELKLDWSHLSDLDDEDRLSQLAKWIEEAQIQNAKFSLKLPDHEIAAAIGHQHSLRCLEALAVYGKSAAS